MWQSLIGSHTMLGSNSALPLISFDLEQTIVIYSSTIQGKWEAYGSQ